MTDIKLIPTLEKRHHALASSRQQRRILADLAVRPFSETVTSSRQEMRAGPVEVLQINVGKRCNQTCRHCHVDAGPDRREVMPRAVLEASLRFLEHSSISTVDITGGAPELHPHFREMVQRARGLGRHVIDRCNLTITQLPNYADLPAFLAAHQVEVIASLPAPVAGDTDAQRGQGVFAQSIRALRCFNELGYGHDGTGLLLNLVTNPVGACLPDDQEALEQEWKRELKRRYDVEFNRLYTVTNTPISRFLETLIEAEELENYVTRLADAFNPETVRGLMCRSTLSVGWDGKLYNCDFNQMLEMALPWTICEVTPHDLHQREILTGQHCYACTAASGFT